MQYRRSTPKVESEVGVGKGEEEIDKGERETGGARERERECYD